MLSPSSSHGFLRPRPPPLLLRQYIENSYIPDATSKLVNINNNTKTKKDWISSGKTCFSQTNLNCGLNQCWQKLADPETKSTFSTIMAITNTHTC